ncbi:serine hydrolase domain-containing protein [Paenibacillus humicola]|uniref:serine hydrolase domain-containing protein n=1 Tax=Paenibacillus humicola TaxID=3110540 RepID=UPI00237B599F|nr:serine hydrolase domain-containing protein [Paenibacillus humicola]
MSRLKQFLQQERENKAFSGAAYIYGSADGISSQGVVGTLSWEGPEAAFDSMWDLASVTKPIVALALMKLFDSGECYLDQPISDFLPAYQGTDKQDLSLLQLLTHTSGIPGQQPLYLHADTKEKMLAAIRGLPLRHAPGTFVEYSSQGFIIVGLVIEAIAGKPLDAAMRELVFEPLGLDSMTFNPPPEWRERIAATEACPWRGVTVQGQVHDENAVVLGGVGGHAGLFSNLEDLAKIAQMMLRLGDTARGRYLSTAAVERMTRNVTADLNLARALGWQAKDEHHSPAGDLFSSRSYGHTGFTGTSLWMDPEAGLFAALLTNRVHPDRRNDRIKRVRAIAHNLIYMDYTQGESADEN